MIFYVNFEVSDFAKSASFYDRFLGELNAKRILERENEFIAWSPSIHDTAFCITSKKEGENPTGDGYMLALDMPNRNEVDRMFALAQELGATVDSPIEKNDHDFYAGCLRDFDGHKIRLFCITA